MLIFNRCLLLLRCLKGGKNQSEEWTYFTLLFIYFITVNKYRFCISVIGYINIQIIGIGYKKINIGRSLVQTRNRTQLIICVSRHILNNFKTTQPYIYIYIYAFSRRFYPKRLTVHSGYTFVLSVRLSVIMITVLFTESFILNLGGNLVHYGCQMRLYRAQVQLWPERI